MSHSPHIFPLSYHPPLPSLPHENRSPFRVRYTSLASYLLFSPSLSGACLVAAGSALASELGLAVRSSLLTAAATSPPLRGALVLALTTALGLIVGFDVAALGVCACSSWYCRTRFSRSASAFCARSALIDFFAK